MAETNTVFGYCRISTLKQSIDRQIRNILATYPDAIIYQEAYTGRLLHERKELDKLLRRVKPGDTIVCDSVSRLSRDAKSGIDLYFQLFHQNINLVFLKERHIDTQTYKCAISNQSVPLTNSDVDIILKAVNSYLERLATKQIELAFQQSEKEVSDLRQRTAEGIETARQAGKQIGQQSGRKLNVRKKAPAMECILKHSKDFRGSLNDGEVMKLAGISRNTFYKYKRELAEAHR